MCIRDRAPTGDYVQAYRDGAAEGDYTYLETYMPNVTYFYFNRQGNSTSGLMESQKVRLALSLAANREEFTQVVFGRHNPAYGFVPLGVTVEEVNFRDNVPEPLTALAAEYDTPETLQALFTDCLLYTSPPVSGRAGPAPRASAHRPAH